MPPYDLMTARLSDSKAYRHKIIAAWASKDKMNSWRKSHAVGPSVSLGKRVLVLVPSCMLTIVCSICLMNLATPRLGAGRNVSAGNEASAATAKVAAAEINARPVANGAIVKALEAKALEAAPVEPKPAAAAAPPMSAAPAIADPDPDLAYLKAQNLLIPVPGIKASELRGTFYDARSDGRIHQAMDIMASQGTPVLATADGKLKLHTSDRGGVMIYQTDPSGSYVYIYGHLQRYAEGVCDGKSVSRGDVIGYVGDTGNAGPGNFHLHFGISKVAAPGKWSGGEPIDPYPLLASR